MTKHWILKTEPNTYSIEDLRRDKRTFWDGIRNYQARNNLRLMSLGDLCLIYHSVGPKTVVGLAEVVKTHYPDPTVKLENNIWSVVDIKFKERFRTELSLAEIKANPKLQDLALIKQSRLSTAPITKKEFDIIYKLCQ